MSSYRQNYKRKWIAACRLINNGNNAKRINTNTSPEIQTAPVEVNNPAGQIPVCFDIPDEIGEFPANLINGPPVQNIPACASDSESDSEGPSLPDSDAICIEARLIKWVDDFQVKHNAVDSLLKLLKQSGHPNLPSTARSLLSTARIVDTQIKSGMEYLHFPLADVLLKNFHSYPASARENVDALEISLNIDGIPLFKSSRSSLWPVLCGIMNMNPVKVFPVTLTYGESKPDNLEFLQDIVRDLNLIMNHGLPDGDKVLRIVLRCVVCDAPAKAMVKSIKLYSGYHGCDKCNQSGLWLGRITYPETQNVQLRTDTSFRNQCDDEHHHGQSPFCDLRIDMVKQFPIDYMHQLCLGVMKKLIIVWMRGKKEVRISARQIDEISAKLVNLKVCIPSCFARKPRGLSEVDRWKATEYRQFLLYTGKFVLKGIISQELYQHFLSLSIASSILASPQLAQLHINYAKELLVYFVEKASHLYGDEFLVYNVHSLIHLADDVAVHGSLDQFSGFPFENYLQKLKRFVRSGKNPIAQIAKRLSESSNSSVNDDQLTEGAFISAKKPNNGYVLNGTSCCVVVDYSVETDVHGNKMYLCRVYDRPEPMFVMPCDSRVIGVHKVCERNSHMELLPVTLLKKQAIVIELDNNYHLFMVILHKL